MTQPLLRQGSRGIAVVALQLRLNQRLSPSPNLVPDGIFGPRTHAAVLAFQRAKGLSADGVVGPLTWSALNAGVPALTMVDHGLSRIPQPTPTTCWAASTAVMTRKSVTQVRAQTPASMIGSSGGLKNGSGSDEGVRLGNEYGRVHGLRCHPPMSWATSALVDLVRRGPVMVDMLWNASEYVSGAGSPGHMVVISAVVSDGNASGATTLLRILDPWPPNVGKDSWVVYAAWVQEVPARTYRLFTK